MELVVLSFPTVNAPLISIGTEQYVLPMCPPLVLKGTFSMEQCVSQLCQVSALKVMFNEEPNATEKLLYHALATPDGMEHHVLVKPKEHVLLDRLGTELPVSAFNLEPALLATIRWAVHASDLQELNALTASAGTEGIVSAHLLQSAQAATTSTEHNAPSKHLLPALLASIYLALTVLLKQI